MTTLFNVLNTRIAFLASIAVLVATAFVISQDYERIAFVSHEVTFTDTSEQGMQIMPASCFSSAAYYHTDLPVVAGGYGYFLGPGFSEAGAWAPYAGMYICMSNTSGNSYFIPALSAYELNMFKSYKPSGVSGT